MSSKVIIFDTSVLCCWLQVPGKDTCGPTNDHWDYNRIQQTVEKELALGSTFVLPLATIIETGNHIAFISGDRFKLATKFADLIRKAATEEEPWAAFGHQADLWNETKLVELADKWPELAKQGLGIGDTTIKQVADYYANTNSISVEILTGDQGLKSHEPSRDIKNPRRRSR